jgi:hypothetical protein
LGAVAVYHAQEFDWERSAGQWAEVFERVTQEGAR